MITTVYANIGKASRQIIFAGILGDSYAFRHETGCGGTATVDEYTQSSGSVRIRCAYTHD